MIKIQIPATSANIGSGFDSLGLAVSLYNTVIMEEAEELSISSIDDTQIPTDEHNLVYTSAKAMYELCGKSIPGLHIQQANAIPMTRGLGSSSACIVGGLLGANALMGYPLSKRDLINLAAKLEGHPDNIAPALMGGLVTAVMEEDKVYWVKQEITDTIRFATFIPDFELKTEVARAALPQQVSHKDAVYNLSRAALMSVSMYSMKFENLRIGAGDRLHQPYRLQYIPHAEEIFTMAYGLGAYAAFISGAGSTLMAIVDGKNETFFEKAKAHMHSLGLDKWQLKMLQIDNEGAQVFAL